TRLIAVVKGTRSEEARARETQRMLAYGFRYFETRKLYDAGAELKVQHVWKGKDEQLALGLQDELYLSLPRGLRGEIEVNIRTDEYLIAPIAQGQEVGTVTLAADGEVLVERP